MSDHFRAFSFVDRILSVNPGVNISGSYAIPRELDSFPDLLVAEALGQVGAWSAMAAVDFKFRPVAGLTQGAEVFSSARPGQVLELQSEIESVDTETAVYSGTAHADGVLVLRLHRHVGPMMALEEFDDPIAVRERFALLCGTGAVPGGFAGLPAIPLHLLAREEGRRESASLEVPTSAPFFADHFPRKPVFPGTIMMSLNFQLANSLLAGVPANGGSWKLRSVSNVKFRSFTPPGTALECEARVDSVTGDTANITVETRDPKRLVASAKAIFSIQT